MRIGRIAITWAAVVSLFVAATIIVGTCAVNAEGKAMSLTLTSIAFAAGSELPSLYTCNGEDISPPLAWTNGPAGTKSFVLIVDDPDAPDPAAPRMTWVHWVLFNIDPNAASLPEGVR